MSGQSSREETNKKSRPTSPASGLHNRREATEPLFSVPGSLRLLSKRFHGELASFLLPCEDFETRFVFLVMKTPVVWKISPGLWWLHTDDRSFGPYIPLYTYYYFFSYLLIIIVPYKTMT